MTPAELIGIKNRSPNVIYHKFVLISAMLGKSSLYCFFEGKDDSSYYFTRISSFFNNFHPLVCYGKENVLAVYSKIRSIDKYADYLMGFFIDRDFDLSCDITGIYETPTYSIENFYCSYSFFSRVLKHELHITEEQPSFKQCLELFESRQAEFHDSIILLNAWYYAIKVESNKKGIRHGVCLEDKIPNGFIQLDDLIRGIHRSSYTIDDIKTLFEATIVVSENQITARLSELKGHDGSKVFRGKYEVQFIKAFLRFLIEDANNKAKRKFVTMKTKFNFQDDLFLTQLSQYADTPTCLETYLSELRAGRYN